MIDERSTSFPLLESLAEPRHLRALPERTLVPLARELRECLLQSVAASGGHLAAGLGAVELTIALHRVFDTPRDSIVWDVGHQCYPHKMLTGRRGKLRSIRKRGGLSGFLRRDESPYDSFGAGHSSTSISAALAMAVANGRGDRKTVAVIGDGALTAGLAYEALNHAGMLSADLLVILNDNGMSISPNVGALSNHLNRLASNAADSEPSLFAALGFTYYGPVDGHDLPALIEKLQELRGIAGPRLLHVVTQKGRGYAPAEADPVKYHGVTPFDAQQGIKAPATPAPHTYTQVFGDWLCEAAARDERVVAITPAMCEGSGLTRFAEKFPDRYFDVGIAEQHSATFAAGLACRGMKPVLGIYSTFLQRAYDQVIHDIALQRLPVLFAIDRAGIVGPDGATHTGAFDLSYLRCIPDMVVMTPSDANELRSMLFTGLMQEGPAAVRYPRAVAAEVPSAVRAELMPLGEARLRRTGKSIAMLVFGTLLHTAMRVAEDVDATVVDMRFVKPLDERIVVELAATHNLLVTIEENAIAGGAGSAVNECLAAHGILVSTLNLGLPDRFAEHGTRDEALRAAGLDVDGILTAIGERRALQMNVRTTRRGTVTVIRPFRRNLS